MTHLFKVVQFAEAIYTYKRIDSRSTCVRPRRYLVAHMPMRSTALQTILIASFLVGLLSACEPTVTVTRAVDPVIPPVAASTTGAAVPITPGADKLLAQSDLTYKGAIQLPSGGHIGCTADNTCTFSSGGWSLGFNPAGNGGAGSLFVGGHVYNANLAEVTLPAPVVSDTLGSLPTASLLQPFTDVTGGSWRNLASGGTPDVEAQMGSIVVYNGKLIGTVADMYDAANIAVRSHFTANVSWLNDTGFAGLYAVGAAPAPIGLSSSYNPNSIYTNYLNLFMGVVPASWQSRIGGALISGDGGNRVLSNNSFGPAIFSFDPAGLTGDPAAVQANPAPVNNILYYSGIHSTLGNLIGSSTPLPSSLWFNGSWKFTGVVWPEGTRTVLFFGQRGDGIYYYGVPTNDMRKNFTCFDGVGTYNPGSGQCTGGTSPDAYFYDPVQSGQHGTVGYPYNSYVWAYDADDLVHVKNGDIIGADRSPNVDASCATGTTYEPWCIVPYGTWNLSNLIPPNLLNTITGIDSTGASVPVSGNRWIRSVAYDPSSQTIYFTLTGPSGSAPPLIHALSVHVEH